MSTPTTRPPSTVPTSWVTSICAAGFGAFRIVAPHSGQKRAFSGKLSYPHSGQFTLLHTLLLWRPDTADPRARHILSPLDILPDSGPASAYLFRLKARDSPTLFHLLDDF
jgi:hypothetical protein